MNRLKGLACYLSGPIDFAKDSGKSWREIITPFLEQKGVRVFNPLKHSFYGTSDLDSLKRPRMDKMLADGDFITLREELQELSHWDLRAVDLSSFLIVNYDFSIPMCGTLDEIFLAARERKPVLIKIPEGTRKKLSKWIYARFPPEHIFEAWEDIKSYLKDIDENPQYQFTEADVKRWLFFDGHHMLENQPIPKPIVIIESPYAGDRCVNTKYAQRCMKDSLTRGEAPFLSHLLYTQCLEDTIPEDRKLGMEAGWTFIERSDRTVVYTDYGISSGMKGGIEIAEKFRHPVEYRSIGKNE
jgi:hypothetical protein